MTNSKRKKKTHPKEFKNGTSNLVQAQPGDGRPLFRGNGQRGVLTQLTQMEQEAVNLRQQWIDASKSGVARNRTRKLFGEAASDAGATEYRQASENAVSAVGVATASSRRLVLKRDAGQEAVLVGQINCRLLGTGNTISLIETFGNLPVDVQKISDASTVGVTVGRGSVYIIQDKLKCPPKGQALTTVSYVNFVTGKRCHFLDGLRRPSTLTAVSVTRTESPVTQTEMHSK